MYVELQATETELLLLLLLLLLFVCLFVCSLSRLLFSAVFLLTLPVSMAARSRACTVFGRSNIGIAGSNPTRGMDVCLCFSVLCCPV
jgi:Zn-dependent membrane protease YugP